MAAAAAEAAEGHIRLLAGLRASHMQLQRREGGRGRGGGGGVGGAAAAALHASVDSWPGGLLLGGGWMLGGSGVDAGGAGQSVGPGSVLPATPSRTAMPSTPDASAKPLEEAPVPPASASPLVQQQQDPCTPAPSSAPPPPPPPVSGASRPPPPAPPAPPPAPPPRGFVHVTPTREQRRRLKALHWDKIQGIGEHSVWSQIQSSQSPSPRIDMDDLEALFAIIESTALRRLVSQRAKEVRFVEHKRAHNICIVLAGLHMTFPEVRHCLVAMDDSRLSVEQLKALMNAAPTEQEREAVQAYLQGQHPDHPGLSDVDQLGTVERFFAELLTVPRLEQRLCVLLFMRSYEPGLEHLQELVSLVTEPARQLVANKDFALLLRVVLEVGNHMNIGTARGDARGFKLAALLRLPDIKASDRKTSLLRFVVERGLASRPSLATLPTQLAGIKAAASIQVSSIASLARELRAGMDMVSGELALVRGALAATAGMVQVRRSEPEPVSSPLATGSSNCGDASTSDGGAKEEEEEEANVLFERRVASWVEGQRASAGEGLLAGVEAAVTAELRALCAYFDEAYDARDPTRTFVIVRDFLAFFAKAVATATRPRGVPGTQSETTGARSLVRVAAPATAAEGSVVTGAGPGAVDVLGRGPQDGQQAGQTPMSRLRE